MYFEAYPLIFQGTYGMSAGIAGLAFLPSMFHFTQGTKIRGLNTISISSSRCWRSHWHGNILNIRLISSARKDSKSQMGLN